MKQSDLVKLLSIISKEKPGGINLNTEVYDSKHNKKDYRNMENITAKQGSRRSRDYMKYKNLNKRGYG